MTNNKTHIEAGDYITAKSNADSEVHIKTVKIDGELALLSPFTSKVWAYRFDNPTTIENLNQFFQTHGQTWIESVEETLDATVYIGEEPQKTSVTIKQVVQPSLVQRIKERLSQVI